MSVTVFDAFMRTAAEAPHHAFLCVPPGADRAYHPAGIELTYGEVRARVLELRAQYAEAGYGHGHRVALLLENRPEFFSHSLALNALGEARGVTVPADTALTAARKALSLLSLGLAAGRFSESDQERQKLTGANSRFMPRRTRTVPLNVSGRIRIPCADRPMRMESQ